MSEKIVVIGASGFVGTSVAKEFDDLDGEIVLLDLHPSTTSIKQFDMSSDSLECIVGKSSFTLVLLGAVSSHERCLSDVELCFQYNIFAVVKIVNECRSLNCDQIIFASSEWVYPDKPTDADNEYRPLRDWQYYAASPYSMSKAIDEIILNFAQLNKMRFKVAILRFGIIYGSRRYGGAVENIAGQIFRKEESIVVGNLDTARNFVHVSDVAAGIRFSYEESLEGTFDLTGKDEIRLRDLIEEAERISGHVVQVKLSHASASVSRREASKLVPMPGFVCKVSLHQGLLDLYTSRLWDLEYE